MRACAFNTLRSSDSDCPNRANQFRAVSDQPRCINLMAATITPRTMNVQELPTLRNQQQREKDDAQLVPHLNCRVWMFNEVHARSHDSDLSTQQRHQPSERSWCEPAQKHQENDVRFSECCSRCWKEGHTAEVDQFTRRRAMASDGYS